MMPRTLSKSDFKVAQECATKLYYRKLRFPTTLDTDDYLKLLAEGGYAVGKLAQLLHPGGVDLGGIGDPAEALRRTNELLDHEDVVIFEAAIQHGALFVRVDVLVKRGDVLELIEVKSTSVDSTDPGFVNKKGLIDRDWSPYIEDVAFQTMVLRQAFPNYSVVPYLMMPDKSERTAIEGLNAQFVIRQEEATPGSRFKHYTVTFAGDVEAVRRERILARIPMEEWVTPLLPTLVKAAVAYAESLNPELVRIAPEIGVKCGKCEYRKASPDDPAQDGFQQCWGTLATVDPSVLDLYRAGNFKKHLDPLIAEGKVSLADIPEAVLHKGDGSPSYDGRPLMQLTRTTEWISDDLKGEVHGWSYPLHFIDFETSRMALPYHKGMRPYEQIGFQWSCHTITHEGAQPLHREWLNDQDAFPSFEFARSLMEVVADSGTVLIWSHHENTTLRDIGEQMGEYGHKDPVLSAWLDRIAPSKDSGRTTRMVDMNALAVKGYFHPGTRGKTGIKYTLPAVLAEHRSPRIRQWLQQFHTQPLVDLWRLDERGVPINPYTLLPAVADIDDYDVREGTGAMRAYQDMLYGLAKDDPAKKALLRDALLRYCKLDTLAMVVIWEHWRGDRM